MTLKEVFTVAKGGLFVTIRDKENNAIDSFSQFDLLSELEDNTLKLKKEKYANCIVINIFAYDEDTIMINAVNK